MRSNRDFGLSVLLVTLLAAGACVEPTAQIPSPGMELEHATLRFSAERDRGVVHPVHVRISNPGTAPLQWSATSAVYWLSTNPRSGTVEPGGSAEFLVILDPSAKEVGEYAEALTFTAAGAPDLTRTLDVVLTITEPPVFAMSTTSLSFTAAAGEAPPSQRFAVSNTGGGVFSWLAIGSAPWITVRPTVGMVSGGESEEIEVTPSAVGLAPGRYTGFVAVFAERVPATGVVVIVLTVR